MNAKKIMVKLGVMIMVCWVLLAAVVLPGASANVDCTIYNFAPNDCLPYRYYEYPRDSFDEPWHANIYTNDFPGTVRNKILESCPHPEFYVACGQM